MDSALSLFHTLDYPNTTRSFFSFDLVVEARPAKGLYRVVWDFVMEVVEDIGLQEAGEGDLG